jgi:hypothetical protein
MEKPLFRWTVGNCLQQGLDILAESINRTTKALGVDNWDWVVCYNGINKDDLHFLQRAIGNKPVKLHAQTWAACPINDNCQSPRRKDGSFDWDGRKCGGTMWKVCPARLRMETHEIVMDNDIVLLRKFPQIDEFLSCTNKALILEEPIRFYGRYDCLFGGDGPFLNSGLMGFPPGWDYGTEIFKNWEKYGRYQNLTQADEQGILTYTLNTIPSVRIRKEQMIEVLHRDMTTKLTGREEGIHFTQANRIPNHYQWNKYKEIVGMNAII